MQNLKLIRMDSVQSEQVKWLWHPYIPLGKITIIQGDPGEGKTTFALALVAALTRGEPMPEMDQALPPVNVIYQTAEDGLGDTIKPRLLSLGAGCSRVLVIDESDKELTMRDKRLEQAIEKTSAKLLVLDLIQAYLGGNVDNVFSCYGGSELIYDRIGRIIENSFVNADAVEITKPSLVDNDIALGDEEWYADTVIKSLRERSK